MHRSEAGRCSSARIQDVEFKSFIYGRNTTDRGKYPVSIASTFKCRFCLSEVLLALLKVSKLLARLGDCLLGVVKSAIEHERHSVGLLGSDNVSRQRVDEDHLKEL